MSSRKFQGHSTVPARCGDQTDYMGRAPQRRFLEGLYYGSRQRPGAGCGPDQVGLGQLTRYTIGTTAQPALRGFPTGPFMGRLPEAVTRWPLDPQGQVTLSSARARALARAAVR
jgi:hypothetical protein